MLKDKVAVVTGGTRGIGYAIVKKYLENGAKVVLFGSRAETVEKALASLKAENPDWPVEGAHPDLTNAEEMAKAIQDIQDQYGRIDILVNNAGIGGSLANMNQITDAEWDKVLATNLTAAFQIMKLVIPVMENNGGGTIVNVASMASTAAGRGGIAYTTAKHGFLGLTRQISLDHGHTGIRINAVLPGPINTQMIARILEMPQHPLNMKIKMSPSGRPGEPEEVAKAIAFLASDESSYIHGASLAVDGGYSIF